MNIYQSNLMDHYNNPRYYGSLSSYDFQTAEYNPSCGDSIAMQGCITNMTLSDIRFTGKGCVISQAAASLLAQAAYQQDIATIQAFDAHTMLSLVGIELGPLRIKCALLPLAVLNSGINQYLQAQNISDNK